jgi:hypothetical protein
MPFATDTERLLVLESYGKKFSVQVVTREGNEFELSADDIGHAVDLRDAWTGTHGAQSAEIFRVLHDGSLNPVTTPMPQF